jgi:hypothetical protein
MRARILGLIAVVAFAFASAPASAAKTKTSKPKTKVQKPIETGDPLPAKLPKNPACKDKGATRWLAHDPINPLALVSKDGIASPDVACCNSFSQLGSQWHAIDAYGQIAGTVEIDGGEGYDVSQCWELSTKVRSGNDGAGLYVDLDWKPGKSARWTPSVEDKGKLAKTIGTLESAMVPTSDWPCGSGEPALAFEARSLFFSTKAEPGEKGDVHWAVVGGPLLVIARLEDEGKKSERWIAHHVNNDSASTCTKRVHQPLAVVDLDGDGVPEVIVHDDYGESYGESILQIRGVAGWSKWSEIASSVGGSTA